MRRTVSNVLFIVLAFGLAASLRAQVETSKPPRPTPENLEAWKDHILPTEEERAFERIDWVSGFAAGLARAGEEGRPLLFYAMNGHPLGCT